MHELSAVQKRSHNLHTEKISRFAFKQQLQLKIILTIYLPLYPINQESSTDTWTWEFFNIRFVINVRRSRHLCDTLEVSAALHREYQIHNFPILKTEERHFYSNSSSILCASILLRDWKMTLHSLCIWQQINLISQNTVWVIKQI